MTQQLLTPDEVTERLQVTTRTVRDMRLEGRGPCYVRVGHKTIRYPEIELEIWIRKNMEEGNDDSSND
mgnify:CR=1 FL=1